MNDTFYSSYMGPSPRLSAAQELYPELSQHAPPDAPARAAVADGSVCEKGDRDSTTPDRDLEQAIRRVPIPTPSSAPIVSKEGDDILGLRQRVAAAREKVAAAKAKGNVETIMSPPCSVFSREVDDRKPVKEDGSKQPSSNQQGDANQDLSQEKARKIEEIRARMHDLRRALQ